MEPWKDVNEDAYKANLARLAAQARMEVRSPSLVHPKNGNFGQ